MKMDGKDMIEMPNRGLTAIGVVLLMMVLFAQLAYEASRESATWDEANHIYAGYKAWVDADFGLNPEHPPLVKLLATIPLLRMPLKMPALENRNFKIEAFLGGKDFVFLNDADKILFRSRVGPAILTLLLALLIFLAAREMFGTAPAFIALSLIAFDPNILGHGAIVTTDVGFSTFLFATAYAFYRYVKRPSIRRLLLMGVAGGLALAAKHTGILIFPMLFLLGLCELAWGGKKAPKGAANPVGRGKRALRLAGALAVAGILSIGVLWLFYGCRYAARPDGLAINPPLAEFVKDLENPREARAFLFLSQTHILPESYVYGLADIRIMNGAYTSFLFGKVYPHGIWYYFPAAFAIKSTLPFLILLAFAVAAIVKRQLTGRREILFLTVPAVLHMAVAMSSRMNIGVRHILPLYVFLSVLAAGAAWSWIRSHKRWACVVAALLLFQAITSLSAAPAYVAYANELWGGPANVHNLLTDSNCDWAQQLKAVKLYLDGRAVKNCWFAYFGQGVLDTGYYGIPCQALPTLDAAWVGEQILPPAEIDGPVLISASVLSGFEYGPAKLNPYEQFRKMSPAAVIENGVFVYEGHFKIPLAAAYGYVQRSNGMLAARDPEPALVAAREAERLAPDLADAQMALGRALAVLGRKEEARAAFEKAMILAKTIEPGFQGWKGESIRQQLIVFDNKE
jgi:hypothetical protein